MDNKTRDGVVAGLLALATVVLVFSEQPTVAGGSGAAPRVACYSSFHTWGPPLAASVSAPIDTLLAKHLARYNMVTLELAPTVPDRPDFATTLRRFNPRIVLLAYILGGDFWLGPTFVPQPNDHSYPAEMQRTLKAFDGWLLSTDGALWLDNYRVNLGDRALADSLASLWIRFAVAPGLFDGVFLDDFSTSIAWTATNGPRRLDLGRAGFASLAAMDSARAVNCQRIVDRIRAAAPAGFRVVCNGTSAATLGADGWMHEGFTTLRGWQEDADWVTTSADRIKWLKAEGGWSGPYTRDACRAARFALGTACIGDAYASFSPDRAIDLWPPYLGWWYDEYAVTPWPAGRADTTGACTGWLGTLVKSTVLPGGVVRCDYPNGLVLVNPTADTVRVDLQRPFWRRIYGKQDPQTNNGLTETAPKVPPRDALFLIAQPRPRSRPS